MIVTPAGAAYSQVMKSVADPGEGHTLVLAGDELIREHTNIWSVQFMGERDEAASLVHMFRSFRPIRVGASGQKRQDRKRLDPRPRDRATCPSGERGERRGLGRSSSLIRCPPHAPQLLSQQFSGVGIQQRTWWSSHCPSIRWLILPGKRESRTIGISDRRTNV